MVRKRLSVYLASKEKIDQFRFCKDDNRFVVKKHLNLNKIENDFFKGKISKNEKGFKEFLGIRNLGNLVVGF